MPDTVVCFPNSTKGTFQFRLETLLNKCCQLNDKDRPWNKKYKFKTQDEHPKHISNVRRNKKLRNSKDLGVKMFRILYPLLFILFLGG